MEAMFHGVASGAQDDEVSFGFTAQSVIGEMVDIEALVGCFASLALAACAEQGASACVVPMRCREIFSVGEFP